MKKQIMGIYLQVFERTYSAISLTSPASAEQNYSIKSVCLSSENPLNFTLNMNFIFHSLTSGHICSRE